MSRDSAAALECSSDSPQHIRDGVRQQLQSDVEAFLSSGGSVQKIADNVRADPPKKPAMNYGSAPI